MGIMFGDDEVRDLRPVFRVGRVAFALATVGAALSSLTYLVYVLSVLGRSQFLWDVLNSGTWEWGVAAPGTFASFLGAMLMIGRGRPAGWQSRAVLLTLLYTYFVGYWCNDHAYLFGFEKLPEQRQDVELRFVLGRFLGLAAILLLASLARDESLGHGGGEAVPLYRAAVAAGAIGLSLWTIFAARIFDWHAPMPPRFFPLRDPETLLIQLGSMLARAVAGFFTMLLCANACALCSEALADAETDLILADPFRSRSEGA